MFFFKLAGFLVLVQGKRGLLILLYVLVVGSTALESLGIASIYPIVDMFQNAGQLDVYRDKLIPWVPALRELSHEQFLFYAILAAASLFLFKNLFLVLAGYWNLRVVSSLYYFWVSRISQIYLNKPYKFFLQNETGDLVQRKIVQTQRASEALRVLIMLLGSGTAILGVLLVLCYMNAKVTLVLIFLLIPVYYISMRFSRSGVYRAGKRLVQLEKQGFDIASETILGIKPIKFSGSEDFFYQRAKKIWKEYSLHSLHARFMPILPRPVLETIAVFLLITQSVLEPTIRKAAASWPAI